MDPKALSCLACVLILVLAAPACSHRVPLNPTVAASSRSAAVPLEVGVYFSEEFRRFERSASRRGDTWSFPIGQASVGLLTDTFDQVFKATNGLTSLAARRTEGDELAAVIEPRIEEFDFYIPYLAGQTYTAEITYRFILHGADGDVIASWAVTGEGSRRGGLGIGAAGWVGLAADGAMEAAARKFSDGILSVPEVRRWLRDRGRLKVKVDSRHESQKEEGS